MVCVSGQYSQWCDRRQGIGGEWSVLVVSALNGVIGGRG